MTPELLELAVTAARAAGDVLRRRFSQPRTGVQTKSSATDMVSDADRAAEALIVEGLRSERPNDTILGEETGEARGSSGLRWVIDPLDGTTNFLFGVPQWAVSIACEDDAGVVIGVVYDPLRDEMFTARRGQGALLDGTPITASARTSLAEALIATGYSYRVDERVAAARVLPGVIGGVRDIRRAGAASLDLAWVAAGRLDGYFESPTEWWDVAAGSLLVTEAGGTVGTLPAFGAGIGGTIAAGRALFDPLHELVARALES